MGPPELGVTAWLSGPSYGVRHGFGLAGLIVLLVLGVNLPVVLRVDRAAEERRLSANDL